MDKPILIGLLGQAGSGKDTVADLFCREAEPSSSIVQKIALADPLKRFCAEVFDWPQEILYGPSELRNKEDPRYKRNSEEGPPYLTARWALQRLGTEWGRDMYPDIWIDTGIRTWRKSTADVCIITDVRFVNEAAKIYQEGGLVWRITRPTLTKAAFAQHASEQEMLSPAMDRYVTYEINNCGTIEDLRDDINELAIPMLFARGMAKTWVDNERKK